jgi:hypothetical protein
MEKNAAYHGSDRFLRNSLLADAWRAMQAPAPAANRAKSKFQFMPE